MNVPNNLLEPSIGSHFQSDLLTVVGSRMRSTVVVIKFSARTSG